MKVKKLGLLSFILIQMVLKTYGMSDELTRQIVIDIDITLTECCATLESNFNGTFTVLSNFGNLITAVSKCSEFFITQAQVGTTGYTITTPGIYQLSSDIIFNPTTSGTAAITINTSNVTLDLQGFSLIQNNSTSETIGIECKFNTSDITIRNGAIVGVTGSGVSNSIVVGSLNSDITITNLQIIAPGALGIHLASTNNFFISGVEVLGTTTGISLNTVNGGQISGSSIIQSTACGISLVTSFSNIISNCVIADTSSAASNAAGISAVTGGNNRIESCWIDNITTSLTSASNSAVGILLGSTESSDIILNNQVSNCTTSGSAFPFGIQMQYVFTTLSSTGQPSVSGTVQVNDVAWSSNGHYLAAAAGTGGAGTITVYEYANAVFTQIAQITDNNAQAVVWSPDGTYLATGDSSGPTLNVYLFNGTSLQLQASLTADGDISSVDWSSNGRFIAIGTGTGPQIEVYEFTGSSLVSVATFTPTPSATVESVNWSPNGQYLAYGSASATTNQIGVLFFNGATLTLVAEMSHGATVQSVNWSPKGQYLAIGGAEGTGPFDVRVLNFTGSALTIVASFDHGATVHSVNWSPDGQYVALGANTSAAVNARVLQFTGSSLVDVSNFDNASTTIESIQWSPEGNVLAYGSSPTAADLTIGVLNGLQFPSGSIIRNNLITTVNGPALATGVPGVSSGCGLSASSATNLIIQNTAFANDRNYQFVTNVFQQYVANTQSQSPSLIANLSFPPL